MRLLLTQPVISARRWVSLFAILLSSSCAATPTADTEEEAYFRDLLFTNNPTGKTYFSRSTAPATYFEDDCVSMTAPSAESTRAAYARHGVTALGRDVDRFLYPGTEIATIVANLVQDVPHYSRPLNVPAWRRKSSDGNLICIRKISEDPEQWRPLNLHFTKDQGRFQAVRSARPQQYGYQTPLVSNTPKCHIVVRARPDNRIVSTDVHVLMAGYGIADFKSESFNSCLIRGTLAAYGLPGVLNKPDTFFLLGDQDAAGVYWDRRPITAAQLYDGPGATWEEVRTEWRRLASP